MNSVLLMGGSRAMNDPKLQPGDQAGVSRRQFLTGSGISAAASALVDKEKLDAVPAAFVQFDAQQCGFCTPGFVVAMRAALDKNPKATPADIEQGLAGNICRCGTYQQMREAIEHLCKTQGKGG